jgi:hypothetical protein
VAIKVESSRLKRNQQIVHEYREEHDNVDVVNLEQVAEWAVRTGRWHRKQPTPEKLCQRELSQALRAETYIDPQGREVRVMHPARNEQGVLWADIHTATPEHMRISLQQRRQAILADCRRHKIDFDSYNQNNTIGAQLPLFDYNFNLDLGELEFPTDYPDARPDDDDDGDK